MKCPVCKRNTLAALTLEDNLPAQTCSQCGGIWVSSTAYFTWQRAKGMDAPDKPGSSPFDPAWETKELKLCPDCGRILARYKIFPDVDYYLDHCNNCNGIWFDKNEWEALAARNLHDNLHEFFTHPWQDDLRKHEAAHLMEELYLSKFGPADYEYIQKVRAWLQDHPRRSMLLAFLQAEDPYEI